MKRITNTGKYEDFTVDDVEVGDVLMIGVGFPESYFDFPWIFKTKNIRMRLVTGIDIDRITVVPYVECGI